jgi:Cu-Zn family superoxide dismutase
MHASLFILALAAATPVAGSQSGHGGARVVLHKVDANGTGTTIGTIHFADTEHGLIVMPHLSGLKPGPLGTHIHESPSCAASTDAKGQPVPAGSAGGHLDPAKTGRHEGPYGNGHLGDLPNLIVEADGVARIPMLAPRAKLADLAGRALVIHEAADRYEVESGHHHAHSMGGGRMHCGVIE